MARINIEDTLWSDPRFMRLCIKLGDEFKAIGAVVSGWRTAQKFWCPSRSPIPEGDFHSAGLPEALIDCGLAERVTDGVRMKGSEEHFAWWFQRQEAGRVGGLASAAKRASTVVKRDQAGTKQKQPSSSSSSSSSNTNTLPIGMGTGVPALKKSKFSDATRAKMRTVIMAYASGYFKKYGANPEGVRDKALVGKLGHWLESVGEDHAVKLIEAYLKIDYRRINESQHDLWQFFYNLNRIGNALAGNGQSSDGIDWSKVFGGDHAPKSA